MDNLDSLVEQWKWTDLQSRVGTTPKTVQHKSSELGGESLSKKKKLLSVFSREVSPDSLGMNGTVKKPSSGIRYPSGWDIRAKWELSGKVNIWLPDDVSLGWGFIWINTLEKTFNIWWVDTGPTVVFQTKLSMLRFTVCIYVDLMATSLGTAFKLLVNANIFWQI